MAAPPVLDAVGLLLEQVTKNAPARSIVANTSNTVFLIRFLLI
jgi:hypothetical protein